MKLKSCLTCSSINVVRKHQISLGLSLKLTKITGSSPVIFSFQWSFLVKNHFCVHVSCQDKRSTGKPLMTSGPCILGDTSWTRATQSSFFKDCNKDKDRFISRNELVNECPQHLKLCKSFCRVQEISHGIKNKKNCITTVLPVLRSLAHAIKLIFWWYMIHIWL